MSRAAFLPTPGDPCLLTLWLQYYERWADEVDRLYVYVNSNSPKPIIKYIEDKIAKAPHTFFIYQDHQIEHGEALRQMVQLATEDYIMFVEDDGFIFKAGKVDSVFKSIEEGEFDIVGSKRGSCSLFIYQEASRIWGLDNSGYGDHGPNFWPNFFFAKREDLLKVTNFGARHWEAGERIEPIKAAAPEEQASDTFVEGSLQLRAMGLRVGYEPQYHGATDDVLDYENRTNIWDGQAPWLHAGSLSSGFHGMLKPDYEINPAHFSTTQEKLELERRIVFYQMAHDSVTNNANTSQWLSEYQAGMVRLVKGYNLDRERISRRIAMYKEVMG